MTYCVGDIYLKNIQEKLLLNIKYGDIILYTYNGGSQIVLQNNLKTIYLDWNFSDLQVFCCWKPLPLKFLFVSEPN